MMIGSFHRLIPTSMQSRNFPFHFFLNTIIWRPSLILLFLLVDSVARKPSYPSSKSKTDWDKLEAEVKKEVPHDGLLPLNPLRFLNPESHLPSSPYILQEKEEKLDGDAALNKLFRDIFRDADDDMRRAMQKSFVRLASALPPSLILSL